MGVVHHSVYAVWLEAGRIAWLDAAGMPYAEIAGGGNHFAVTGVRVEYRAPARFGDVVQCHTQLENLRSRQVSFAYEVRNAGRRRVARHGERPTTSASIWAQPLRAFPTMCSAA